MARLTTVSDIRKLEPQVAECAGAGLHVVSTCEELFFPWNTSPEVAERIDRICKDAGIVCLGTGVNPGCLMDFPPTVLSGLCQSVDKVEVWPGTMNTGWHRQTRLAVFIAVWSAHAAVHGQTSLAVSPKRFPFPSQRRACGDDFIKFAF